MGRVRLVAVAALVAALAAGCGDAPTPKFAPPPSTEPAAPTTTAASDPLPPEMPELAKKHTVAGAKAFVKYYWAVVNYAQREADPQPLVSLADSNCSGCKGASDAIRELRAGHGVVRGGATSVNHLRVQRTSSPDGTVWMDAKYGIASGPERIDYPGSKNDETYSGGAGDAHMALRPTAGGWQIDLLEISS